MTLHITIRHILFIYTSFTVLMGDFSAKARVQDYGETKVMGVEVSGGKDC